MRNCLLPLLYSEHLPVGGQGHFGSQGEKNGCGSQSPEVERQVSAEDCALLRVPVSARELSRKGWVLGEVAEIWTLLWSRYGGDGWGLGAQASRLSGGDPTAVRQPLLFILPHIIF